MISGTFTNSDVDTSEKIVEITISHYLEVLWISFLVGTANLSAFTVEYCLNDNNYFTVASAAADYTTPEGPVLGASSDLTTAASGSTVHWLKLDVQGVEKVRIKAAGTSSTVTGSYKGM